MSGATAIRNPGGPGDAWGTPLDLFEEIRARYLGGDKSVLDPSPNPHRWLPGTTWLGDGLLENWREPFFCNPPFSDIGPWATKARTPRKMPNGSLYQPAGVLLVPARTDQPWFNNLLEFAHLVVIRGRVQYVDPSKPDAKPASPSFASVLFRFGYGTGLVESWFPECHLKRARS